MVHHIKCYGNINSEYAQPFIIFFCTVEQLCESKWGTFVGSRLHKAMLNVVQEMMTFEVISQLPIYYFFEYFT